MSSPSPISGISASDAPGESLARVWPLRQSRPEQAGRARATAIPNAEVPSDAELIARCRNRDADAWRILVERYERLVYSVALRNGLSSEDAADVTQTTFVALIDSLPKLRDHERLPSWLMTVARRQAWRQRNISRAALSLDHAASLAEDPVADWDSLTAVHDALGQLGGICRELLVALYFDPEEPSYAEIAARMGRSIGGIGPLRGRCLTKLRTLLDEDGEGWSA